MHAADLLELRDDLTRETQRLEQLVISLAALKPRLVNNSESVEAAALRLHSFYTGVERMLLLVSRVVNGGTPSRGEGLHRRLHGICRSICASATWCATFTPMNRAPNRFNG